MDTITFAELTYNGIDFVIVKVHHTVEYLMKHEDLVDMISREAFNGKPVIFASDALPGQRALFGRGEYIDLANNFDLSKIKWECWRVETRPE